MLYRSVSVLINRGLHAKNWVPTSKSFISDWSHTAIMLITYFWEFLPNIFVEWDPYCSFFFKLNEEIALIKELNVNAGEHKILTPHSHFLVWSPITGQQLALGYHNMCIFTIILHILSNSSLSLKPRQGVDFVFPPSQQSQQSQSPPLKFSLSTS